MDRLDDQIEVIEAAMHGFFIAIKQPAYWSMVAKLANTDIDRPAAAIIQRIAYSPKGYCNVQELADRLHIEAPSITRKTQELEADGLIIRSHDENDKRVVIIKLTEHGKQTADSILSAGRDLLRQTLSVWSDDDRQKFAKMFKEFTDNLSNQVK
jgi:DNA-binding MarR family transcriptional regulator